MGAGRVIGNGIASDAGPWALLGNSPTRLRGGLSARGAGLLDCVSAFRLARIIYRRRTAGVFGDLHSRACSGIAGVATRARPAAAASEDVDLRQATRRLVHLRRASDDGIQLYVTRHPGFVRDFSGETARFWCEREISDQYSLATMGAAPGHHSIGDLWDAAYSALDLRTEHSAADHGRVSDSVHGARGVGSCAGSFERTFSAGISRDISWTRLPIGKFRCRLCCAATSVVGGTFPSGKRRAKLRPDHGTGRSGRFSRNNFPGRDRARRARQRILTAFSLPTKMHGKGSYFERSSWLTQLLLSALARVNLSTAF